ncbi:hypothetical protein D6C94_03490 [Lecanosticta acicola]|uniref:N-acetylgalactosaminide beta-1,3-galactosyltransferase n=1 Tax=Lecanosticta acicola TaxID=111012 RepID=A0AAI8YZU3_9PEZI|nr:hypothetical protein D6C94_03490 [Lecanosticta acicola]
MSTLLPMWPQSKRRSRTLRRNGFIFVLCCLVFSLWKTDLLYDLKSSGFKITNHAGSRKSNSKAVLPCRTLPGADETLVILKTGATELQDRLPVHLKTTFRCYPHYIIVSDHAEAFQGETIRDVLGTSVSTEKLDAHADFGLYRRLRDSGRKALEISELSGSESQETNWSGNRGNRGWKVDKWKFLPMVNSTYYEFPQFRWYVFLEADTYVMWATLLQYLQALDSRKEYYLGNQMVIGEDVFAHGGSGFVVSNPAMKVMVDYYRQYKGELEAYTDWHWAGDCVLGMAFKKAKIPLTYAWPIIQEGYPGVVPYGKRNDASIPDPRKRLWCYPTASFHHVSPEMVEDLWEFEMQWLEKKGKDEKPWLRHKEFFEQYLLPRMRETSTDWDSENDLDQGLGLSLDECEAKCKATAECMQWSLEKNGGLCKIRNDPGLGKYKANVTSGWMYDRIVKFTQDQAPCGDEGWILK